jgi:hypothetical protein
MEQNKLVDFGYANQSAAQVIIDPLVLNSKSTARFAAIIIPGESTVYLIATQYLDQAGGERCIFCETGSMLSCRAAEAIFHAINHTHKLHCINISLGSAGPNSLRPLFQET